MSRAFAEIAFTPGVRTVQERMGSSRAYGDFLNDGPVEGREIGETEARFITKRDGFYQASVSETGWPYVQFRGGPAGFLKVLDKRKIAYADFRGNRQYLSTGNLSADERIALILMDYPNRLRMKIWGRARLVEAADDPDLIERLVVPGYKAKPERAVVITVEAYDWNCPQHIPMRLTMDELEKHLSPIRDHIAKLTEENQQLKAWLGEKAGEG